VEWYTQVHWVKRMVVGPHSEPETQACRPDTCPKVRGPHATGHPQLLHTQYTPALPPHSDTRASVKRPPHGTHFASCHCCQLFELQQWPCTGCDQTMSQQGSRAHTSSLHILDKEPQLLRLSGHRYSCTAAVRHTAAALNGWLVAACNAACRTI
jgi:hypothetical protein